MRGNSTCVGARARLIFRTRHHSLRVYRSLLQVRRHKRLLGQICADQGAMLDGMVESGSTGYHLFADGCTIYLLNASFGFFLDFKRLRFASAKGFVRYGFHPSDIFATFICHGHRCQMQAGVDIPNGARRSCVKVVKHADGWCFQARLLNYAPLTGCHSACALY